MKKNVWKTIISYMFFLCLVIALAGCGKKGLKDLEDGYHYYYPSSESESSEMEEEEKPFFLILSNDTVNEVIHVYSYENKLQYQYHYSLSTSFKDKYGNRASAAEFIPGRAIWIGDVDSNGKLIELGISDRVWEYRDIKRFETDPEEGRLTIASTLYSYGKDAFSFSDGEIIDFSSITKDDILFVVGVDKKILSVNITTGHGTLELQNTDLFEGSFMQIGSKIFAEVTKDMTLDLQEGTYTITVANNGWGGSTEVVVEKGKTTVVDLDTIKGEGPKYGLVAFVIDEETAELYIDGENVDFSEPIRLQYGKHSLSIKVDGLSEWKKYLYVNSAEATIEISVASDLENSETQKPTTVPTAPEKSTESTESTESSSSGSENGDYSDLYEYLNDYLSTLSSLL